MTDSTIELGRREAQALRQQVLRTEPHRILIRKAAVLGAGVMGAQIAAHLANANVQPYLFELAADGKDKNANARKAIDGLAKLSPSPLAVPQAARQIIPANYDEHLPLLAECDLVIEAISERMDWKKAL
ncbi:MAG TPA: 3-hydroxyacyl-CoA dehydrogenase NAD-binding domain-containing protein, partial [Usitatibacter sp.]|nr:3-hydroxyacyl-CoA dehydrogenase NAD-binding domain-containing protein [Usitatibacter sp.]